MKLEGLHRSLKKANKILGNIVVYIDHYFLKNLFLLTLCFHVRRCLATLLPPDTKSSREDILLQRINWRKADQWTVYPSPVEP